MDVFEYLSDHWGLLVLLTGMAIVLGSDVHLEKRMVSCIFLTGFMICVYSVTCYIETYLGNQPDYSPLRPVLCAVNYSLVTFILVNIILIMYPMQKRYLFIPAVMNAVLCFISIPTGLVFRIKPDNHFGRGLLGFLPYFINALYLVYLIYNSFHSNRAQKEDYRLLIFMYVTAVLCLIVPLFEEESNSLWFTMTIAIDVMLYYVFLLQQFTKRDSLTKLLNRQSFYADAGKYANEISAVVTMDMNGLKELNDSKGHVEGDTALRSLADCFWKSARPGQRVYRIGGDEYAILCIGSQEPEVCALIERMRKAVAETPYTCSIGYAMKTADSTVEQMYQLADRELYEEKKEFYLKTGKKRWKRLDE